jgi:hypothetical protein
METVPEKSSQAELMIVGRVTVLVLIGLSILWLPILQQTQEGRFWFYIQSVRSYLTPSLMYDVPPWVVLEANNGAGKKSKYSLV